MRKPNFENLLKVLRREKPDRPTLFEFFLNGPLYEELANGDAVLKDDGLDPHRIKIHAFKNAGYDYATIPYPGETHFPTERSKRRKSTFQQEEQTISLNEGTMINDREDLENYPWPDPDQCDYSVYDKLADDLPDGMKIIVHGPGGVLENAIALVGYDNLCLMSVDDPKLTTDLFAAIGGPLVRHYERAAAQKTVGALISNDDWGFKTQTMLSPAAFREYLFPWHKRIVEVCHAAGKPVILHSCGNLSAVMDDIVEDMKYDGKHSYEDGIQPVEEAYEQLRDKIAIMGGIDVDFICRSTPDQVRNRSLRMLEKVEKHGAFALGTGNSVPEYVPKENYYAMISAVQGL